MTRAEFEGDLRARGAATTGVEGADNLCNQAADAAGLGGIYTAWISSSDVDAADRILDASPWETTEGTTVLPELTSLRAGPTAGIRHDEHGEELYDPTFSNLRLPVWTGTAGDGTSTGWNCGDWTNDACSTRNAEALDDPPEPTSGSIGVVDHFGAEWTVGTTGGETTARLYCLEQ